MIERTSQNRRLAAITTALLATALLILGIVSAPWPLHLGNQTSCSETSAVLLADSLPSNTLRLPPTPVGNRSSVTGPSISGLDPAQQASLWRALSAARHGVEPLGESETAMEHNKGVRLFAQNPGQQFTARFLDDRIRIGSGRGDAGWQAEVSVRGLPPATQIAYDGTRVEYTRGAIIEWYDNRPEGLQQGFIVQQPPSTDGTLRMEISIAGLDPQSTGEDVILLSDAAGEELLSYSQLVAWDARGTQLAAHMESIPGGIALVVAAQGAQYPVTIDPVFASFQQKASYEVIGDGAPADNLGSSIAVSGNTVVVGTPGDDLGASTDAGSAYVFVRNGAIWLRQAKLTANDAMASDKFGSAVAISGDTIVVGSPGDDTAAGTDAGSAYVFIRTPGTVYWSQTMKLTANDAAANDAFGSSAAIAGTTILVGSPGDDTSGGANAGSAHVFALSTGPAGSSWTHQAKLTADDAAANDAFGTSVALLLNTALIGAPKDDTAAGADAGSAYAFLRVRTVWSQQAKLTDSDAAPGDFLGSSVALSGETALAGAPGDDTPAGANAGSASAFIRSKGTWTQQAKLTRNIANADDQLGFSVAISGNTAVLGAPGVDGGTLYPDKGIAYIFVRSRTGWIYDGNLNENSAAANSKIGSSVALSGTSAFAGAPFDATPAGAQAGGVTSYTYLKKTSQWFPDARLTAGSTAVGIEAATSVALSGNTALIGAPYDDTPAGSDAGRAYVLVRVGNAWLLQATLTDNLGSTNACFGFAVALSGDHAVVGAPGSDTSAGVDAGSALAFTRDRIGRWSFPMPLVRTEAGANDAFGTSVALSGTTALVGAPYDTTAAGSKAGSAYIFVRSKTGYSWPQQARLTPDDAAANDFFGSAVAIAGTTAVIGAPGDDTPAGTDTGSAYAFIGSRAAWSQQAKLTAADAAAGDKFGQSAALFGNSALIGAPSDDTAAGADAGSAYAFVRSRNLWTQKDKLVASDAAAGDQFGFSVALFNDTALVGAPFDNTTRGAVYNFVLPRRSTIWQEQLKLTAVDGAANDKFGTSLALSANTAMVGAPWDDTVAGSNTGSVYVYIPY